MDSALSQGARSGSPTPPTQPQPPPPSQPPLPQPQLSPLQRPAPSPQTRAPPVTTPSPADVAAAEELDMFDMELWRQHQHQSQSQSQRARQGRHMTAATAASPARAPSNGKVLSSLAQAMQSGAPGPAPAAGYPSASPPLAFFSAEDPESQERLLRQIAQLIRSGLGQPGGTPRASPRPPPVSAEGAEGGGGVAAGGSGSADDGPASAGPYSLEDDCRLLTHFVAELRGGNGMPLMPVAAAYPGWAGLYGQPRGAAAAGLAAAAHPAGVPPGRAWPTAPAVGVLHTPAAAPPVLRPGATAAGLYGPTTTTAAGYAPVGAYPFGETGVPAGARVSPRSARRDAAVVAAAASVPPGAYAGVNNGRNTIDTEVNDSLGRITHAPTVGADLLDHRPPNPFPHAAQVVYQEAAATTVPHRHPSAHARGGVCGGRVKGGGSPGAVGEAVAPGPGVARVGTPVSGAGGVARPRAVKPKEVAASGKGGRSRGPRSESGKNVAPSNHSAFSECSGGETRSIHSTVTNRHHNMSSSANATTNTSVSSAMLNNLAPGSASTRLPSVAGVNGSVSGDLQ